MRLERKIKDDMADLHRQYIEEKDKAMNKKSANVAGEATSVQYKLRARHSNRDRSVSQHRSERERSPDTYSIYKRNDEIKDGIVQADTFRMDDYDNAQLAF